MIAPGVNAGTDGFGTSTVIVPAGSYITYLVSSDPALAGRRLQIRTKTADGAWTLTTTRTVAADGTVHHFARVREWTGFWAKLPADAGSSPATSHGRIAAASRYEAFRLVVSCDEFRAAQGPDTGTAALRRIVRIKAGGEVAVTLCSNPSTGFRWGSPRYDPSALALVRHSFRQPTVSLPGAAGSETWVFRTLPCPTTRSMGCPGSTVALVYGRPSAGASKALWTFTLTVRTAQTPVIDPEPPLPPEPGMR
jgi:predicted secreted protein